MEHKKNVMVLLAIAVGLAVAFAAYRFLSSSVAVFPFSHSQFDSYVRKAMDDWHVPGLALAVIKDDKIAYIKCYGVLKEGEDTPVNEQTIFAIGSCSKAFTAAALGMLVDDGKIKWDDKARTYLPDLQLPDEYMTRELTIRDMLSHRSGLEEVGMLWDHTTLSRKQLMERMKYLKAVIGFRTGCVYNNLMFLSAGQIIPAVTGMSWDDFIVQRIFSPLNMKRSSTSVRSLVGLDNVASPHCIIDNKAHAIEYHNIDSIAPAGAINSTITDMAEWVRLFVSNGLYNGERVVSADTIDEMSCPQVIFNNRYPYRFYALGLGILDHHNHRIIFHEGNIDGMSASFAFSPDKKIGIIILTNMHQGTIGKVVANYIFDRYFAIKPAIDWNAKLLAQAEQKKAAALADEKKKEGERLRNTTPSLDLSSYAGVYHSDLYGNLVIAKTVDNRLSCQFVSFKGVLEHWQNDTFIFNPSQDYPLFKEKFSFVFGVHNNKVRGVQITYPDEMDGIFKKVS